MKMIVSREPNESFKIIYKSNNIKELHRALEEICFNYLNQFQVSDEKYYRSKSKQYGKCPEGYFVIAGRNKLTIFNKRKNLGYFINSYIADKVITFILINPEPQPFKSPEKIDIFAVTKDKIEKWDAVHEEIKKINKSEKLN